MEQQVQFIHKYVNARMFQKGGDMVFELDQANRMLKLFKDNFSVIEDKIRREIDGQYRNKVLHKDQMLAFESVKFNQMRQEIVLKLDEAVA